MLWSKQWKPDNSKKRGGTESFFVSTTQESIAKRPKDPSWWWQNSDRWLGLEMIEKKTFTLTPLFEKSLDLYFLVTNVLATVFPVILKIYNLRVWICRSVFCI